MKKRFFFAAVIIAAALLPLSCTKENAAGQNGPDSKREIVIRPVNVVSTRSGISSTDFPALYDMSVSIYRNRDRSLSSDVSGNYFEGIQYSRDETSGAWKSVSGPKYWPQNGKLDFLAIACAGLRDDDNGIVPQMEWGEGSNAASKVVLTVQDDSDKFDDLLYGSATAVDALSQDVDIEFHHAFAAVAFAARSDVGYDAEKNVGVTIDGITVDGASFGGKFTVTNTAAGNHSGAMSASWSDLTDVNQHVAARVWNTANTGADAEEEALSELNLTTEACSVATSPFGEAYVLLPQQDAVPFTISYTLHNGFAADGQTPQDNELTYTYYPYGVWEFGKKYFYILDFNLNDVQVKPTVLDWTAIDSKNIQIAETVAATYSFSGISGNITLPKVAVGENCALKINWGDNTPTQVYENRPTKISLLQDGGVFTPTHFYSGAFYGKARLYVEGPEKVIIRKADAALTVCDPSAIAVVDSCIMFWSKGSSSVEMRKDGSVTAPTLEYSLDGASWNSWNCSSLSFGGATRLYLRGKNPNGLNVNSSGNGDYNHFMFTGEKIYADGNAFNLLDYKNPAAITTAPKRCFFKLFLDQKKLQTPLELPATTMSEQSYAYMYSGAWQLQKTPELPAMELANACYEKMFNSCRSITAGSALRATAVPEKAYYSMYQSCTKLTAAPSISALTVDKQSCYGMFAKCYDLVTGPVLKPSVLAEQSYYMLCSECESMTSITVLAEDISANQCVADIVDMEQRPELDRKFYIKAGTDWSASGIINWTFQNHQ